MAFVKDICYQKRHMLKMTCLYRYLTNCVAQSNLNWCILDVLCVQGLLKDGSPCVTKWRNIARPIKPEFTKKLSGNLRDYFFNKAFQLWISSYKPTREKCWQSMSWLTVPIPIIWLTWQPFKTAISFKAYWLFFMNIKHRRRS